MCGQEHHVLPIPSVVLKPQTTLLFSQLRESLHPRFPETEECLLLRVFLCALCVITYVTLKYISPASPRAHLHEVGMLRFMSVT